jgi:SulP family sulfate permease
MSHDRISVVKHIWSEHNYRSNVDRRRSYRRILRRKWHWFCILEPQGSFFLGTANDPLERVRQWIRDLERPSIRLVVLDFWQTTGLDASAMLSFADVKQLTHPYNMLLVLSTFQQRPRVAWQGKC